MKTVRLRHPVGDKYQWTAVDENGECFAYVLKPVLGVAIWHINPESVDDDTAVLGLGSVRPIDWKDSLKEIR